MPYNPSQILLTKIMKLILLLCFTLVSSVTSAQELQPVSFASADGGIVHADYFHSGSKAIVLAHGAIFNKESWSELTKNLLKNNISVLAINFRGYGESTAGNRPVDKYEDILAAVRFLHTQPGISQISVLGASMGGRAAAKAVIHSSPGEINQLILLSPATVTEPEKLKGDILYIASESETIINAIKAQYQKTPEPKQLKLIEGKAHAQHIFKTQENTALNELIIHFLKSKSK